MGWALITTTSSSPMRSHLFSPVAMSESADIGSPWDPVEITHTWPGGKVVDVLDVDLRAVGDADDAEALAQLDVLAHGPAQRGHLAPVRHRGVDDLLHAVHVAGEAGHDEALARLCREHAPQHDADRGLGLGEARLLGVRRVGQQEPDPLALGQLAHPRQVGAPPVDGLEVELEVARVQDHALRGVEGDGERLGHRVGHRDELDIAGADRGRARRRARR